MKYIINKMLVFVSMFVMLYENVNSMDKCCQNDWCTETKQETLSLEGTIDFSKIKDMYPFLYKALPSPFRVFFSITFPSCVTKILPHCFEYARFLQSVDMRKTSIKNIPGNCFNCCVALSKVLFSRKIESIEADCFSCCAIKNISIPECVTCIGSFCFMDCVSLEKISLPNSITSIGGYCFLGCSNLSIIKMSDNVIYFYEHVFAKCEKLEKINFPSNLKSIGFNCFEGCSSLKKISLPNSLTGMGEECFKDCSSLQIIQIPHNVNFVGKGSLDGCSNLDAISLPAGLQGKIDLDGCNASLDYY